MIQQTSLMAYERIKPDLNKKQQQVLEIFKKYDCLYDNKLSHILKLPINEITPRRYELEKLGFIQFSGKYTLSQYTKRPVRLYNII